jgi:MATE family multidrug resistance protein
MPHSNKSRLPAILAEMRSLWQLAWPMLVGQLATVGMGVSDVAMTGHVSAGDLAAVSLGASIWAIVIVTVMGVIMAINAVVAHEMGAGNIARVPHVVRQAQWKAAGIGIAAFIVANLGTYLFDVLDLDSAVHDKATAFVHVISFGLPAFTAYRSLYGYSTSIHQTKPMMLIAMGGLGYNIVVNWLLVYGHLGMPKLGAVGCAVATASGCWLMLGAMLWWMRASPAYRETYPFTHWEGPNRKEIGAMLKLGWPIGVTFLAEASAFSAVCFLVARFGVVPMAANQIALNFISLVFMVPLSFGIGLITRVGHAAGEGDPVRARFAAWVGVGMSLGFGVLSAMFIASCRYLIASAYTPDPAVQAVTADLLLFAAIFQLSDSTQVAAASAVRGYKVTRTPMLIHLLAFWGCSLPLGCLLGLAPQWMPWHPAQPMAAQGFWIGLAVGLTVAALSLVWFLTHISLRKIAERRT